MNCLIRVHPICNNIGSIGVHFGIELAFYIIRYLACLNVLVKCYQTPAQRMRALTNSVIDTVMHYHIYHYNRPSAIGHQPSAIGNHRWYLAKKAVPIYIYIYISWYFNNVNGTPHWLLCSLIRIVRPGTVIHLSIVLCLIIVAVMHLVYDSMISYIFHTLSKMTGNVSGLSQID